MDLFFRILGYVAAVLTTVSFIPQAYQCITTRKTDTISLWMYILFVAGVIAWAAYGFYKNDLAIILANSITAVLSSIILVIKIVNLPKEKKERLAKAQEEKKNR
jgi:MtN3 and saliva related transmembrane protein